jgi:hypothetical protein
MPQRLRAASLLLAACFPCVLGSQAPVVRDSAGVRIIVSPAVADAPVRFTLADKPDVVIGGIRDDPEDELSTRISYPFALRLSASRFLVTGQDHWGIFSAQGKLLSRIGRGGAGPGEFRVTQNGCRFRGDSLLLWDQQLRRVSIWGPDGRLAREYTPPGHAFGTSCLTDGSIMVEGARMATASPEQPMRTYAIVSSTGVTRATTAPLPATLYAGSVWREIRVVGVGDRFYFADPRELGMRVLDRNGKVISWLKTRDVPLAVTDANLATYSVGCRPDPVRKKCTPFPTKAKNWPAFSGFAVDDSGRSWFRLLGGRGDSVWVGFDATGQPVGKLLVPPGVGNSRKRIIRFGAGDVFVSDADPDGAPRVSVFRIVPATRR